MTKIAKAGVGLVVSLVVPVALAARGPVDEVKPAELVGTWKTSTSTKKLTHLKHVTPTHYTLLRIDEKGNVERALCGSYTIKGTTYEEKTLYGTKGEFEHLRDGVHKFTCKLEGKKWIHTGKLANGNTIDEVWERVE